jgi:hypothetical protein
MKPLTFMKAVAHMREGKEVYSYIDEWGTGLWKIDNEGWLIKKDIRLKSRWKRVIHIEDVLGTWRDK